MLIALVLIVLALFVAPVAAAEAPPGPRIAAVELFEPSGLKEEPKVSIALATFDPSTGTETRLRQGKFGRGTPVPFYGSAWSADGAQIAYGGYGKKGEESAIFTVAADGTGLREVPRTVNGTAPVLSPDGRTLAFARNRFRIHVDKKHRFEPWKDRSWIYSSTSTWVLDLAAGGKPRRLTPWENGLSSTPTSFSPDGSSLLLTREDGHRDSPRVMRISLADGKARTLVGRAKEAVYSPDGSRIAFTGYLHPDPVEAEENRDYLAEELYVANADGAGVRRLSRSKGVLETSPSWDPSGQRLAYVQFRADTTFVPTLGLLFPVGNSLMQVNADGTCRAKIASSSTRGFYGVAWQPGPGREAGPLSC